MLDKYLNKQFGFRKTEENEHAVVYERIAPEGYTHVVCIHRKNSGRHLIQSYDKNLIDEKKIGNTNVGLTPNETLAFWLKAKCMMHKYHWNRRR